MEERFVGAGDGHAVERADVMIATGSSDAVQSVSNSLQALPKLSQEESQDEEINLIRIFGIDLVRRIIIIINIGRDKHRLRF